MMPVITAATITAQACAPFGDLVAAAGTFRVINQGRCRRFHDLARLDVVDGWVGINLFQADMRAAPYLIEMMERHPLGSQCFIPMQGADYLVVVAHDDQGRPGEISAFLVDGMQGVNYHRNIWHAVLTPISGSGLFAVIDRIGEGANLEEHWFDTPIGISIEA